jgi:hypothetical protein
MKTLASINEIQVEMQRRIDGSSSANGYCASCLAPMPFRIEDDGVANWRAHAASTARPGCEGFLLDIVASVRQDYDLPAQLLGEAVDRLLSGHNLPL